MKIVPIEKTQKVKWDRKWNLKEGDKFRMELNDSAIYMRTDIPKEDRGWAVQYDGCMNGHSLGGSSADYPVLPCDVHGEPEYEDVDEGVERVRFDELNDEDVYDILPGSGNCPMIFYHNESTLVNTGRRTGLFDPDTIVNRYPNATLFLGGKP